MELSPEAIEAFTNDDTFVPPHLREGIINHIQTGRGVGNFLDAVLCNDLRNAIFCADRVSLQALPTIVRWLHNYAPSQCHGNENHVRGWIDAREADLAARAGT